MGFNCLKATEPLRGGSLLFTSKFPEIHGTHLIDLGRMKGLVNLGAAQRFWTRDPLVWESSALTTRPLVHKIIKNHCLILEPKFGDDFLKKELHRTLKEVTSSDLYQKIFNWKIELSKILMNNKKILSLLPVPWLHIVPPVLSVFAPN